MIAVAVIGIEAALIVSVGRSFGRATWYLPVRHHPSPWPPILICLVAPPTLVFLSAFGRPRSARGEKNSFGPKECRLPVNSRL
jgi:hypothetical protein